MGLRGGELEEILARNPGLAAQVEGRGRSRVLGAEVAHAFGSWRTEGALDPATGLQVWRCSGCGAHPSLPPFDAPAAECLECADRFIDGVIEPEFEAWWT